ncbi:MAG TPA: hypothetical protein VK862_06965 [Afifellaceae bacterium]|nr:hypothetical protein [Afifellaceae bacterium]
MNKKNILVLAGAFVLMAGTVQAASITNRDTTEHYLQISDSEDSEAQEVVISAEESFSDICMKGCMIGVDGDDSIQVDGSDNLVIQDGVLSVE